MPIVDALKDGSPVLRSYIVMTLFSFTAVLPLWLHTGGGYPSRGGSVVVGNVWRGSARSHLGPVVFFTVGLVPQNAVHIVHDGRGELWKNLWR